MKFGRKFRDQFVKVKNHARMEHAHRQAHVSARKVGLENFVINERTKGDETAQNHNKIEVETFFVRNKIFCDIF